MKLAIVLGISAAILAAVALVGWHFLRPASSIKVGGIYATPQKDGSFGVIKVLKVDDDGVHVRIYSNRFKERPRSVLESELFVAGIDRASGVALGMGHAPVSWESFSEWKAKFVQQATVSESELEGYHAWSDANGGYF
jgi:hypothetical protein